MSANEATTGGDAGPDMPKLTERQILLIRETWKLVTQDLEGVGVVLFFKLFEIAPKLQDLFAFGDEELSESNEKLKKHAVQVMTSVGAAIDILEDQDTLEDVLLELGIVHNMKSVQVGSFAPVGQALVYALSKELGDKFTPEVQDAYVSFYGLVQYYMEKGMDEGLEA